MVFLLFVKWSRTQSVPFPRFDFPAQMMKTRNLFRCPPCDCFLFIYCYYYFFGDYLAGTKALTFWLEFRTFHIVYKLVRSKRVGVFHSNGNVFSCLPTVMANILQTQAGQVKRCFHGIVASQTRFPKNSIHQNISGRND